MSKFKAGDIIKDLETGEIFELHRRCKDGWLFTNGMCDNDCYLEDPSLYAVITSPKNQVIDQMNAEQEVVLQPGEVWEPCAKKCTCGISAIGGGMHSDWCDLYEGEK